MNNNECDSVRPAFKSISVVAYCALPPNHIFLRVPTERARWLITERCCAEVECPLCKSTPGEPCRGSQGYQVGVHVYRRNLWYSRGKPGKLQQHKPKLSLSDLNTDLYPLAPVP